MSAVRVSPADLSADYSWITIRGQVKWFSEIESANSMLLLRRKDKNELNTFGINTGVWSPGSGTVGYVVARRTWREQ